METDKSSKTDQAEQFSAHLGTGPWQLTALVLNHLQAAAINAAKILPPPGSVTVIIMDVYLYLYLERSGPQVTAYRVG